MRFSLPSMELENQYTFYGNKPTNIQLSSNSSRLSVIDSNALLYIIDLDKIDEDGQGKGRTIIKSRKCQIFFQGNFLSITSEIFVRDYVDIDAVYS